MIINIINENQRLFAIPSESNFFMIDVSKTGISASEIRNLLIKKKVVVKNLSNVIGIDGLSYLRVSDNKR